jgi:hypothetical protein
MNMSTLQGSDAGTTKYVLWKDASGMLLSFDNGPSPSGKRHCIYRCNFTSVYSLIAPFLFCFVFPVKFTEAGKQPPPLIQH